MSKKRSVIKFFSGFLFYISACHLSFGNTDDSKNGDVKFEVLGGENKLEIFAESTVQKKGYTRVSFRIKKRSFKSNLDKINAVIEIYGENGVLLEAFHKVFRNRHVIRRYIGHIHRPEYFNRRVNVDKRSISTIRIIQCSEDQHKAVEKPKTET